MKRGESCGCVFSVVACVRIGLAVVVVAVVFAVAAVVAVVAVVVGDE